MINCYLKRLYNTVVGPRFVCLSTGLPTFLAERFIMGGDVCFQTPHLSQEQEVVQMVWVCHVLPGLNANTKNTQLECRTWQRGQVGGQGFVATLRAYFDTRGPSD